MTLMCRLRWMVQFDPCAMYLSRDLWNKLIEITTQAGCYLPGITCFSVYDRPVMLDETLPHDTIALGHKVGFEIRTQ